MAGESDDRRKKLSDDARFFLTGMSKADQERALREKSPEQLDKAGKEVRSALSEEDR